MSWLKRCLVIFAVFSALCVSGPALYYKLSNNGLKLRGVSSACTPCSCHCTPPKSILQVVPGLANLTITECGKDDPGLKEEMEKQFVDLLSEEIRLQGTVGKDHSQHMNINLREAKRVATQYQREAEKCNAATETCEGARERAETLLSKEKKLTLLWERKARLLGWESN